MVQIYWAKTTETRAGKSLEKLLDGMPPGIRLRAFRYKLEAPAYNFVVGRVLLKKGLEDFGLGHQFGNIEFSEKGKPFIKGLHFNISHTEGLVVCAFSTDSDIGIDVEKLRPVNLPDFASFFTEKEWKEIYSSKKPIGAFFKLWVRKESIIKAMGINLKALNKINTTLEGDSVLFKNNILFLKELDFGAEHIGAICSQASVDDVRFFDCNLLLV